MDRPTRTALVLVAAVMISAAAGVVFAALPPTRVMVGTLSIDQVVPWHYQITIFPCFALFAANSAVAFLESGERTRWVEPSLVITLALLAFVRLGGKIGLSGHGVCAVALITYPLLQSNLKLRRTTAALALMSLLVTGWYKLAVWGDRWWFVASLCVGAALGLSAFGASHRLRSRAT